MLLDAFVLSSGPCLEEDESEDCAWRDGDLSINCKLGSCFGAFFLLARSHLTSIVRIGRGCRIDGLLILLRGPLPTEYPPFGFPEAMCVAQVMPKGVRVFHLRIACARGRPRGHFFDVLILDVGHQRAVPGPLPQPLGGWAVAGYTERTEPGIDKCVAVHPYRTPFRHRGGEMTPTMFFPGTAAVKPFEAEEAILHGDRSRAGELPICSPRRELFATTGVDVVGSVPFHLGQLASTYRTSSVNRLLAWAVHNFKIPCAEGQEVLHGRQPLRPRTGLVGLDHLGKASTLRQDAEQRLGPVNGRRSVMRYPSSSVNDFCVTVLEPFLLPACQCSSFEPMKIGSVLSLSLIYGLFGRLTFPKLAEVPVQLGHRWIVQEVVHFFCG